MNFIVVMTIYINDWCYYNFVSEKKKHKNKIYADWKECKEKNFLNMWDGELWMKLN